MCSDAHAHWRQKWAYSVLPTWALKVAMGPPPGMMQLSSPPPLGLSTSYAGPVSGSKHHLGSHPYTHTDQWTCPQSLESGHLDGWHLCFPCHLPEKCIGNLSFQSLYSTWLASEVCILKGDRQHFCLALLYIFPYRLIPPFC